MKKLYAILAAFVVALFASSALAWDPPPSPAPVSWISDSSHVLSDAAHSRLDAKLKQINQGSANEIAALILPTLDGENIADVGDLTAKSWGVGKKGLDNGVLVVLAMKEHKSRISTGKGIEGDLPDLKTNDILQQARPYLRKGDIEGALGFIFDSTSSAIANHKADVAAGRSNGPSCDISGSLGLAGGDGGWLFVISLIAFGLVWWVLAKRSAQRRAENEERERQAREERIRLRRLNAEREATRRAQEVQAKKPSPPISHPVEKTVTHTHHSVPVVATVAATGIAAAELEHQRHRAEEERRRRERDEEDRRRRDREEEDRRRESSSSSSSSFSFDWGGSSGGGGSGSGGFGGGDSGGGGSSSDW